jgi:4-hydroxy-3-methylbut-2-enyl diphosphate reductase
MGGKNSSNSSHLVELCEQKLPTYFIDDASKVISKDQIQKTDWKNKESVIVSDYLPKKENISILMTSGASCPDAVVEAVIHKITSYYGVEDMLKEMEAIWSN